MPAIATRSIVGPKVLYQSSGSLAHKRHQTHVAVHRSTRTQKRADWHPWVGWGFVMVLSVGWALSQYSGFSPFSTPRPASVPSFGAPADYRWQGYHRVAPPLGLSR